jgi:hypothetical protein
MRRPWFSGGLSPKKQTKKKFFTNSIIIDCPRKYLLASRKVLVVPVPISVRNAVHHKETLMSIIPLTIQ